MKKHPKIQRKTKKALVFNPHRPYPSHNASHLSELMVLSALKDLGYEISVFGSTLASDFPWDDTCVDYLQKTYAADVYVYKHDFLDSLYLQRQGLSRPDLWDRYNPPWFLDAYSALFNQVNPDVVVVDFAWWGKLAASDEFNSAARIIISHDSLAVNEMMQATVMPFLEYPIDPKEINPYILDEKLFERLRLDEKVSGAQEYRIYDRYDATIACSAHDEEMTGKHTSQTVVKRIPITLPVEEIENTYQKPPMLVMSNYSLNIQGYAYFAAKVLPRILKGSPDFELNVIGKACENILPEDNVQLLGYVPDLKPLYAEAKFAICPVIGGTGVQVKVVEAMAHGVPVVALKNIAHSSPIKHGVNGLIAENAKEYAEYCGQLFKDQSYCRKLGQAARETIREHYNPAIQKEKWREAIAAAEENRIRRFAAVKKPKSTPMALPPQLLVFKHEEGKHKQAIVAQHQKPPAVPRKPKKQAAHKRAAPSSNSSSGPKISIITPTLNCAGYIDDCIQSVLSQNYENFEHIIIDGDSKDGTVPILQKYEHLNWISEPDKGEADALNKGLRIASGEVIGWLNADDFYTAGALETASELINPNAGHHAVYGKVVLLGHDDLPIGIRVPTSNINLHRLLRWHRPLHIFQPAIFYSRELMEAVGDHSLETSYAVDLDYWIRVVQKGYTFEYVDRTFAKMRLVRQGGKTDTPYDVKEKDWLNVCLDVVSTLSDPERVEFWRDYYWHRIINSNLYPSANFHEPIDRQAILGLALASIDTNAFEPAKEFIAKSIQENPDLGDLYWLLGEAHFHLHLVSEAAEIFKGAETLRQQQDAEVKTINKPRLASIASTSEQIIRPAVVTQSTSSKKTFDGKSAAQLPFGFNVISYVSGNLGVGITARGIIQNILDKGHPVSVVDLDPGLGRGKFDKRFEKYAVDSLDNLPYAVNLFVLPLVDLHGVLSTAPQLASNDHLNVAWSIWELSVVPAEWASALHKMDAVIAESNFIRHAYDFGLSGMKTIGAHYPFSLPEDVSPDRKRFDLPADATIFFTSFDPFSDLVRKNPAAVVDAFERALGENPQAYLLLKVNNAKANGEYHPAVESMMTRCQANSRIKVFAETLSYADVLSLYASCDVFVSLHRAEGFGLCLMEAMRLGKPVIATGWSGNMSFMNHSNACLVGFELIPVAGSVLAYSPQKLGRNAVWADPDIDETIVWMKRLMEDSELRKSIGEKAAEDIAAYETVSRQASYIDEVQQIWDAQIVNAQMLGTLEQFSLIQRAQADAAKTDIVIPIYGQADLLERCVNSVLATTEDAHLILVDDQSPGGEIRALFDGWKDHERITLARTLNNLGFIGTCKAGASLGTSEYVLFLNSDTEAIEAGWLEALIPEQGDVAITGAKLLYPPDIPGPLAGKIQHIGIARNSDTVPYHPYLGWSPDIEQATNPCEVNAITGACYMIRREVWDELGGWDERFGRGVYEDVDLCWQARKKGYKVLFQPAAKLYHYESASKTVDGRHLLNENTQRNLTALLQKWKNLSSDEKIFFGDSKAKKWARSRRWINRVQGMLAEDKFESAANAMSEALSIAPDLPEALIGQAQLLSKQGLHEKAVDHLRQAIDLSPANWDARSMLVDELITVNDTSGAQKELAHLQAVFPNHPKIIQRGEMLALFMDELNFQEPQNESSARILEQILEADDIIAYLSANQDKLDRPLYDLVCTNAQIARDDGQEELAGGLENLAEYIDNILMA